MSQEEYAEKLGASPIKAGPPQSKHEDLYHACQQLDSLISHINSLESKIANGEGHQEDKVGRTDVEGAPSLLQVLENEPEHIRKIIIQLHDKIHSIESMLF